MKRLARTVTITIAVITVALGGTYLAFRRADVPYALLESKYSDHASRYVALADDVRIHYREEGPADGHVLLLVHGQSASSESWREWSRQLSQTYRIISIDLPGHGLTRAPADYAPSMTKLARLIDEFATSIELTGFTVVGHSMGGHVAWTFAESFPRRTESLVLIASGGLRAPASGGSLAWMGALVNVFGPLLADLDPKFGLRMSMKTSLGGAELSEAALERAVEMASAPGHREIAMAIHLSRSREADVASDERKLARIAAPTLILWGERDEVAPISFADRFGVLIPTATVIRYPTVGHVPQVEIASQSAIDVRRFLTDQQARVARTPG
jgi:pimeloyl-ACP methyl ester carboxylesterase